MAAGRPYQFGNVNIVYVSAQDPEIKTSRLYYNNEKNPLSSNPYNTGYDTLDSQEAPANIIIEEKSQNLPTKNQVILDQIAITPGGLFGNRLPSVLVHVNLGMLTIKRFGLSEFGINPDFGTDTIPVYIELESYPHRITTELFGMKRYGFGTGFGVDYSNINVNGLLKDLMCGNSSFEFVSEETIQQISPKDQVQSIISTMNYEGEYTLPRLARPFRTLNEALNFVSAFVHDTPYHTAVLINYILTSTPTYSSIIGLKSLTPNLLDSLPLMYLN